MRRLGIGMLSLFLMAAAAFAQVKLPLPKASSLKNVYETSYELAEELEDAG